MKILYRKKSMKSVLNKVALLTLVSLLVIACKSKKNLPEGAPEVIKLKELRAGISDGKTEYQTLRIRAQGNLETEGQNQGFRLEVRILRDSLIWAELADPILGLKVARALITPDSLFVINRIDREYLRADISAMQQQFGVEYGFNELQNALSGNPIFDDWEDFELYYVPGHYLLSTTDPARLEQEAETSKVSGTVQQAYISPGSFKAVQQLQFDPAEDDVYRLTFEGFEKKEGSHAYPRIIELHYGKNEKDRLRLAVKRFEFDDEGLPFPFNIPDGYAEMR